MAKRALPQLVAIVFGVWGDLMSVRQSSDRAANIE